MPDGLFIQKPDRIPETYFFDGNGRPYSAIGWGFANDNLIPDSIVTTLQPPAQWLVLNNPDINGFTWSTFITHGNGQGPFLFAATSDRYKNSFDYAFMIASGATSDRDTFLLQGHIEAFVLLAQHPFAVGGYTPAQSLSTISFF